MLPMSDHGPGITTEELPHRRPNGGRGCQEAGTIYWIGKPFYVANLAALVRRHLRAGEEGI